MKSVSRYPQNPFLFTTVLLTCTSAAFAATEDTLECGPVSSDITLSSTVLNDDSRAYLAYSEHADGRVSGRLAAYALDNHGNLAQVQWNSHAGAFAGQHWDSGRNIVTYKPSSQSGIPLRWPDDPAAPGAHELDSVQIDLLRRDFPSGNLYEYEQGRHRLEYLRGNDANTGVAAHQFPPRPGKLGDFAGASPLFVGSKGLDGKERRRTPMLYIVSNNGLLHGFNALSGREEIAYLPDALLAPLSRSAQQSDAGLAPAINSPTAGDAGERTVLLAALSAGGQGVFALDISDPDRFSEQRAGDIALWEFSDANDADLGFIRSKIAFAPIAPGRHAAIFGNGYHNNRQDDHISAAASAVLFILDALSGALLAKLDTGVVIGADSAEQRANGLSAAELIDSDGDTYVDIAYAGDVYGNLWKFRKTGGSAWEIAYRQPLFSIDAAQAILMRPRVIEHPQGGFVILFASGALDKRDIAGENLSDASYALYAIWDKNETTLDRPILLSDLVEQKILEQKPVNFGGASMQARITSDYAIDWRTELGWYMRFTSGDEKSAEQVVAEPIIRNGLLIVPTGSVTSDACISDPHNWLTVVDALTGRRSPASPFDLNADGRFSNAGADAGDFVTSSGEINQPLVALSALQPAKITTAARILTRLPGDGIDPAELMLFGAGSQTPLSIALNPFRHRQGRLSWREIMK